MIFQFCEKVKEVIPMKVTILTHTPEPEKTAAAAARLCYSNTSASDIFDNLTEQKAASFISRLVEMGHMSPVEHVSFTFGIDGVSRALLAQITRHRIASFSVQSLRYNNPFDKEEHDAPSSREADCYERGLEVAAKPGEGDIPEDFFPAYLRGIYDSSGVLTVGANPCIELPAGTPLPSPADFGAQISDGKLTIRGEGISSFANYIYGCIDIASGCFSKERLLELCGVSEKFRSRFLENAKCQIDSLYYSTLPAGISKNPEAVLLFMEGLIACKKHYLGLIALGADKEDARSILPMSTQTRIVMTMNVRSLYNFFNLRCCERAQSEIRELAYLMLQEVKKIAPGLFGTAGAPCEAAGICPEGPMSCGKYPTA